MTTDNGNLRLLTPSSAKAVSDSPIAALRNRIATIEHELEPIAIEEAGKAVALMLKAFGTVAGSDDPALARMYLKAVEGHPRGAIERLCEDIAFGRVEGVSLDFPPKVPLFANLCRARSQGLRASLRNRQRELGQLGLPPPERDAGVPAIAPGPPKSVEEIREAAGSVGKSTARAREERIATEIAERRARRESVEPPCDVEAAAERGSG